MDLQQVIQNILNIRKQEVQVRASLLALGLDDMGSEAIFELVATAYSFGWEEHSRAQKHAPKVNPPKANPPKVNPPKVNPPKVNPPKVNPPKAKCITRDQAELDRNAVLDALGTESLCSGEILQRLEAKNSVPNANDPKTYIAYILSSNKHLFTKDPEKGRGYYRKNGSLI
jgi:hypothetical protein